MIQMFTTLLCRLFNIKSWIFVDARYFLALTVLQSINYYKDRTRVMRRKI